MRTPKWPTAGELLCYAPLFYCLGLRDMLGNAVLDECLPRGRLDFIGIATTTVAVLVHRRWCGRAHDSDAEPNRVELNPISRSGAIWMACGIATSVVDDTFGESLATWGCPPGMLPYVFVSAAITYLVARVVRSPRHARATA